MRAYQIAAASVAMCTGLLFTSYLKAAEVDPQAPVAQMNRASYAAMAAAPSVFVPPRRPQEMRQLPASVAQMNRAHYVKPAENAPLRPVPKPALQSVSAQMNRDIYDR
ncbi:MAG: hypothetical protein LCH69_12215 [Proteobacteria bacterium]|nr:hypothetical protein [Pseudomonadota bacterium]